MVLPFTVRDIPAFALDDLVQDSGLCGGIYEASGLDVLGAADGEGDAGQDFENEILLALSNARDGDVITLTKDYYVATGNFSVHSGSKDNPVILDLNGHTINASEGLHFDIYGYGALQIRDSGAGGKMLNSVFITLVDSAYLFLDGGTIKGSVSTLKDSTFTMNDGFIDEVNLMENSTFIMNGGTIEDFIYPGENSTFTMNGGTINGSIVTLSDSTFTMYGGIIGGYFQTQDNSVFTIHGGTIEVPVIIQDNSTFTMNDGTICEFNLGGSSTSTMYGGRIDVYVYMGGDSTFTMYGGTIDGEVRTDG